MQIIFKKTLGWGPRVDYRGWKTSDDSKAWAPGDRKNSQISTAVCYEYEVKRYSNMYIRRKKVRQLSIYDVKRYRSMHNVFSCALTNYIPIR